MDIMGASIVIVAKNEAEIITYITENLMKQTIKPGEIIVAVDTLSDPTAEAARRIAMLK